MTGRRAFVIRLRMGRSLRESSCKLRHCLSRNGHQSDIVARSGRRSFLSIGSRLPQKWSTTCIQYGLYTAHTFVNRLALCFNSRTRGIWRPAGRASGRCHPIIAGFLSAPMPSQYSIMYTVRVEQSRRGGLFSSRCGGLCCPVRLEQTQ